MVREIDHFPLMSLPVHELINIVGLPGLSPRMYCMRYLDDLITIACCVPELRTIEFRPFPIENVLGGVTFAP